MLFSITYQRTSMNIKTLSEIFSTTVTSTDLDVNNIAICRTEVLGGVLEFYPMKNWELNQLLHQLSSHAESKIWLSIRTSLNDLSLSKASLLKDLGDHSKDPVRVLTMLLLNLSSKDVSELREALGIPELTQQS